MRTAGLGHVVRRELRPAAASSTRRCGSGRSRGRWCGPSWRGCWPRSCASCARAGARCEERHARSTLDDYVRIEGYSRFFRDHFVVPFAAALWLTSPDQTLGFPARLRRPVLREPRPARAPPPPLADGHRRQPPLRRAITAPLGAALHLDAGVRAILRDADGVTVRTDDDRAHRFDAAVVATHAAAGACDARPTPTTCRARRARARSRTTLNSTVLHTDARLLPRAPASRASWNYRVDDCTAPSADPTVTYYLNRLQRPGRARALLRDAEPRRADRGGPGARAASRTPTRSTRSTPWRRRRGCRSSTAGAAPGSPARTTASASTRTACARA